MADTMFTVLLDYDGTLVDQNLKEAYRLLLNERNVPKNQSLVDELYACDRKLCKRGEYDRRNVFRSVALPDHIGGPDDLTKLLWSCALHAQRVKGGALAALQALKAHGATVCCVTETDGYGSNKKERVENSGLGAWFGKSLFIAGQRGVPPKTSLEFWNMVLQNVPSPATRCYVVGDKPPRDLVPPMSLGMRGLHVWNGDYPFRFFPFIADLDQLVPTLTAIREGKKTYSNIITFISHAWEDIHPAEHIRDFIWQEAGAAAWIAKDYLKPGQKLEQELHEAVLRCPIFLVILTEHSRLREWVRKEIRWALGAESKGLVRILPVLDGKITTEQIPQSLAGRLYVDLRNKSTAERKRELQKAYLSIRRGLE